MSIENFQSSPVEESLHLPTDLLERSKLTKNMDACFEIWSRQSESSDPTLKMFTPEELIVLDCRLPMDFEAEYTKNGLPESSLLKSRLESRSHQTRPMAIQANNTALDTVDPINPEYRDHFDNIFAYITRTGNETYFAEAYVHLRRLYIARERIAVLNGRRGFDITHFRRILEQITDKEFNRGPR